MKNSICVLVFLISGSAIGQTFRECVVNYTHAAKKAELDRMTYKISAKASDSKRAALDSEFEGCIIGKRMGYDHLINKSETDYNAGNLHGKVVLFNFWSVRCGWCIVEIPYLNRLYTLYRENKDFVMVSVLLDDQSKLDKLIQSGVIRGEIRFPVLTNDKITVKENLSFVRGMPMNLFVDRDGKIFMRTLGAIHNEESFEKMRSIIDNEILK